MAKQIQFRRGTTSQHSTFTGVVGEVTVDTDLNTFVVHDGTTVGGHPLASSLAALGVTASAADLNTTDVTTLGTVEASKVVTADANGNVTFPDGDKAVFGAGSDLLVYHDGSTSYIYEQGTGDLRIRGNEVRIEDGDGSTIALFQNNAGAQLRYNGTSVLNTTSTGIDVTGEFIAYSYNETYAEVTSSSNATTVNCEAGNTFSHTLTENTTFTFSNPPASGTSYGFTLKLVQDAGASGFTVTWPTSTDWPGATAPTLTATASAVDVFVYYTHDGGITWYGFVAGQGMG